MSREGRGKERTAFILFLRRGYFLLPFDRKIWYNTNVKMARVYTIKVKRGRGTSAAGEILFKITEPTPAREVSSKVLSTSAYSLVVIRCCI